MAKTTKSLTTKEHNQELIEVPLAETLNFWTFDRDEDITIYVDGSMGGGFELSGIDQECASYEEINQKTAAIRSFLNSLHEGLSIQIIYSVDSDYTQILSSHDKKTKKKLIDLIGSSRLNQLNHEKDNDLLQRAKIYLFFRFNPTESIVSKMKFFEKNKDFIQRTRAKHKKIVSEINSIALEIESSLKSCGISTKRLSTDDTSNLIYQFLNPERSKFLPFKQKITSNFDSIRNQLTYSDLSYTYNTIRIADHFYNVITIKELSEETHAGLMSNFKLPFHYYFSTNIFVPSYSKEVATLKQKRRLSHSLSFNQGKTSDLDSEAQYEDAEEILKELISSNQKIFLMSWTIVLKDTSSDQLEKKKRVTLQRLRELGLEGLKEDVSQFKVFKSAIPASCEKNARMKRFKTDNAADLLPFYKKSQGNEKAIALFKTRDNGLFKFNLFDEKQSVWNFLVSGASGSGKSFLVNNLILQFLKEFNSQGEPPLFRILDIGGSYKKITNLLGGRYFEIHLNSPHSINPFELPADETVASSEKISTLKAILETILKEEDKTSLPKLEKSLLEEEIVRLYESIKGRSPRFSDLRECWQKSKNPILNRFSTILYPWTHGTYGRLLNPKKSTLSLNQTATNGVDIATFDLKGLSSKPELQTVMLMVITDLLWRDIAQNPGRMKILILDECWQLLKSATSFIEECYRTFRKYGASVGAISQGIEDFKDSPIATAILNNAPTRFILAQKGDLAVLKDVLKLNEREIELISSLSQVKGEYSEFFLAQNGHHILRLCPSPLEYHLSTTHHKDKKLEQDYRKKYPALSTEELFLKLAKDFPKGASDS